MNIEYSKMFYSFDNAIRELTSIIPDLKDYIDEAENRLEVTGKLLHLIYEEYYDIENEEEIPEISLELNSSSLKYWADDMMFAFEELEDGYEFTFSLSSNNKRKIKRIQDGFDKYDWQESNSTGRVFNAKEAIKEKRVKIKEEPDVQDLPHKETKDYSSIVPLPTFIQDDEESPKEEVQQQETYPIETAPKLPVEDKVEIVEEIDARRIRTNREPLRQTILPNGMVTKDTRHIDSIQQGSLEILDPASYNIRPTQDPATVVITHEGRNFPVNVYEQHRGVYRDPANKKLTIGNVVYDYNVWKAFRLPEDFKPDNATFVGANKNMIDHQQVPDEVFVPRETILKNADIDIDAIQEEAMARERHREKITGIESNIQWNRDTVQQQQSTGNVLRKGRSFVIDSPKQNTEYNQPQTQSVQIINEDQMY